MVNLHTLLYLFAVVFFVLAALQQPSGVPIRFEWLAAACLTLTLLV